MARARKTQRNAKALRKDDVRGLLEALLDSYEARLKKVGALMVQATETLEKSRQDQERMMEELRECLARRESLRRKDFDTTVGALQAHRRHQEGEVSQRVASFLLRGQAAVEELRGVLSDGADLKLQECKALSARLLGEHESFERRVGEALLDLHVEQEELSAGLKKMLAKGERVRIRDLKVLARTFHTRQSFAKSEMGRILEEFNLVREDVVGRWRGALAAGAPLAKEA